MSTSVDVSEDSKAATGLGLTGYVRVARAYWRSICALTVGLALLATVWGALQPRVYAAESSALVLTVGSENLETLLTGDALAKSKIKNYKSIAESRLLADRVIKAANLKMDADALMSTVTISVPLETAEIRVTAKSPDPATAQRVANTWISELANQVQDLEKSAALAGSSPVATPAVGLTPLDTAPVPTTPVSPNVKLAALFGLAAGLFLGYASALLRHHLDRRIRKAEQIEQQFGVPVIGTLPVTSQLREKSSVVQPRPGPTPRSSIGSFAYTEALRELRTNLGFVDVDNPPRVILITSSIPAEGKSTVAANLAAVLAAGGESVVVVDGDLRRPSITNIFGLVPGLGVTDVLSGHARVADALQIRGDFQKLLILGAGRTPPNPSELLASNAMAQLLKTLSDRAIVLIDAPPLLPVTDAAVLSKLADGAVLVVRAGKTTRDNLARSLGNIRKVHGTVLGTVLNCVPTTGADGYARYRAYGHFFRDSAPEPVDGLEPAEAVDATAPPKDAATESHARRS
jgi:capsular exopolysaccharide synthesis family protein